MAALGELVVSLTANTAKFTDGLNKANFQAQKTFNQMKASVGGIGTAIAGAFSVGAIVAFTQKALLAADAINDVAKANDVAVSSVLRLSQALTLNGGQADSASRLFSSLTNKIDEAAGGSDKAQESFAKAGITLKDLGTLDAQGLFEKTLAGLSKIEDPIKRNALAMEIFGKAAKGVDITGLANDYASSEGDFKDAEEAFKKIGVVMDELDKFTMNASVAFAENLGPALADGIGFVNDAIFGFDELAKNIKKAADERKRLSPWKETAPLMTDKPKQGQFNFGEYSAENMRREVQMGAEALKAAKEAADKAAKYREDVLKSRAESNRDLIKAATELNATQETEIEKIQSLIPLYEKLDSSVAKYLSTQIELKRMLDMQANDAAVFADTLERAAEVQNEVDEQRMESGQKVSDFYTQVYNEQQKEYEDLQVAIITSDTERVRKQLELESERAKELIRNSELEQELKDQLIADEERNLKIRIQSAEMQNNAMKELRDAIDGYSKDMAQSLAEFALGGKASFGDMIDNMMMKLLQFVNQKLIFDPLFKSIGDSLESGSGFFGGIGNIFKSIIPNANGGIYSGAGINSYSGSIVDSPTVFPFAKGVGLMGEAGAEAIMPLTRGPDGKLGVSATGGGGVVVNVIEAQGTKATVQQQQNSDGTMSLNIIIEQLYGIMNRDLQRGGGIAPTIERRYGLNRVAGAY